MALQGKEMATLNTWRDLTQTQGYSASARQVSERLGVSWSNTSMVFTRLVRKGYLERLGRSYYRECTPTDLDPAPVHLSGTSRDRLVLHIELTGKSQTVLDDVNDAIDRLTWFKNALEARAVSP